MAGFLASSGQFLGTSLNGVNIISYSIIIANDHQTIDVFYARLGI